MTNNEAVRIVIDVALKRRPHTRTMLGEAVASLEAAMAPKPKPAPAPQPEGATDEE